MNTYTHLATHDLVEAGESIPNPATIIEQQQLRATGTHDHRSSVARTESETSFGKTAQRQQRQRVGQNEHGRCCAHGQNDVSRHSQDVEKRKKPLRLQRLLKAEGKG